MLRPLSLRLSSSRVTPIRRHSTNVKPYYITTPIFYPNGVPHIGHLYSLVSADIFARYQRCIDPSRRVIFATGTDEHGLKIQRAAESQSITPIELCDRLSDQFRTLAKEADISYTRFIRTTESSHYDAVKHVWAALVSKGLIYQATYSGWYSVTDECFYTDSQITSSIESPDCKVAIETGSAVEYSSETNYMFRLSAFRDPLLQHYQTIQPASVFPETHRARLQETLENGVLEDISVSRPRSRLSWGIPVPGDEEHTMYVWIDALINYLTVVGYPETTNAWPPDIQLIGKDIVRFHALYLPAMLLALGLPLQHRILAHAHWTASKKKMSKSVGNVADPFKAIEKYGVDSVRYYLAKVGGRFRNDVDWSDVQLAKHDKQLQTLLGNLFLRITSPTISAVVSSPECASAASTEALTLFKPLRDARLGLSDAVSECMDNLEVADALDHVVILLELANKTMTISEPWKATANPADVKLAYDEILETLRVAGICLQPFVPAVATRLLDNVGVPKLPLENDVVDGVRPWMWALEGHVGKVNAGNRLFSSLKKAKPH